MALHKAGQVNPACRLFSSLVFACFTPCLRIVSVLVPPPVTPTAPAPPATATTRSLLLLCSLVLLGFLTLGISLGTLPTFITHTLHYDSLLVGVVIGLQSVATLASRHLAGTLCDSRGGRRAVTAGLLLGGLAGSCYLLANATAAQAALSLGLLLVARLALGLGESLLVTGVLAWGIGLLGVRGSGKVMAWNGIAMYGGLALGAPLGMALQQNFSLGWAFAVGAGLPLLALPLVRQLPVMAPPGTARLPFYRVVSAIWRQGSGLALASVGFSTIASFGTLYFARQHWAHASLALTLFGGAYILVRLLLAHLPDKFGGRLVAGGSLLVEVTGLVCVGLAPSPTVALAGVALTGAGFSLVFPALGVEAVARVLPQNRGAALGAYAAFFDLALGLSGPVAGLVAEHLGYGAVYLLAAGAALAATGLVCLSGLPRPTHKPFSSGGGPPD